MSKQTVAILFGGQSSEHEVSLRSAAFVMDNVDDSLYNLVKIGITKQGRWYLYEGDTALILADTWQQKGALTPAIISPDASHHGLLILDGPRAGQSIRLDCAFPVLHGKYGEDGTIQGLLQLAGIPCVGPGLTASANAMDKVFSRILFDHVGIPQAKWTFCTQNAYMQDTQNALRSIETTLPYPVFVKPANAGSSVGVSKVEGRAQLTAALELAFLHDSKAVIEEFVNAREIEISALGDENQLTLSVGGEIVSGAEFYDYEAKYISNTSTLYIPAEITPEQQQQIASYAAKAFHTLGCCGLSRIDFFIRKETGAVLLNEINTIPGFTSISMYPKLLEHSGVPAVQLVTRLLQLAK